MANPQWLKELQRLSPGAAEKEIRYENARYAISEAYKMVAKFVDTSVKVNGEWIERPASEFVPEWATMARLLAGELLKDLNSTLKILEDENGTGNKELSSQDSRPS